MIDKIEKIVNDMQEDEAKHLLQSILIQLDLLEEEYNEDSIKHLMTIPKQLMNHTPYKRDITESTHIHIAFDDSMAGCLKYMLSQEGLRHEHVASFSEFFSIGPIYQLDKTEGQQARQQWLSKNLNSYDFYFEEEYLPRFIQSLEEIQSVPSETPITIWKADNAHEHVGLCFVLAQLTDKKNVRLINTSEAHRELLQKDYDIRGTGELSPESLAIIREKYKENPFLAEEDRTKLEKEWEGLSTNTEVLRIWKDNEVHAVQENYFDAFIIDCAKKIGAEKAFYKAPRVIGEALGHVEQLIGDTFLEYRLQTLIKQDVFKVEGSLKAMRFYSVKLNR
ncbi:DUF1835 domain-containing protein [Bacillus gaemokensis]|uniref:DUF1835 domain-containing protein n=1 Tax=Bacillus gaemokensis TaxID=574375 RepID=A0A073K683_9BACI|nr:DUF1835 domain-containing protein [Bacillus gaemokensis]KEK22804.1 hypothetical protein BAGA_16250 [Bacillus gaemokensis]KYG36782.1 hypothetical protein AZF08_24365 [Bacillus gaemokensis]